jgi:hypothetical protein
MSNSLERSIPGATASVVVPPSVAAFKRMAPCAVGPEGAALLGLTI